MEALSDTRTFSMTFIRFTAPVACYFRIGKQASITNVYDYVNRENYDFMNVLQSCFRNCAIVVRHSHFKSSLHSLKIVYNCIYI